MRAPNALKAVKPYNTDQAGPPDLSPPKVYRPATDFAREMDVTSLETPREPPPPPPPPNDNEEMPEEFSEEEIARQDQVDISRFNFAPEGGYTQGGYAYVHISPEVAPTRQPSHAMTVAPPIRMSLMPNEC